MTTGPNTGSRTPPDGDLHPGQLPLHQHRALFQQLHRRGAHLGGVGEVQPHPAQLGAVGGLGQLHHHGERGRRGDGLVGGAAERRGRGVDAQLGQQCRPRSTGSVGVGARPHRRGCGRGCRPCASHGVAAGVPDRPRGAGGPVEARHARVLQEVGVGPRVAGRHPAHVHRHRHPVGAQARHHVAQPLGGLRVERRALQQHRDDDVDLAGAGQQVGERRGRARRTRDQTGVTSTGFAGLANGGQHRPDLVLQRRRQGGHRRGPRRPAGPTAPRRRRRSS